MEQDQMTKVIRLYQKEKNIKGSKQGMMSNLSKPQIAQLFAPPVNEPAEEMAWVNHLKHGPVTSADLINEQLEFHFRTLMSPKVRGEAAKHPPWEENAEHVPQQFKLETRGSEPQLMGRLTYIRTTTALKRLKYNKASGPDGMPNEIIKHVPECYKVLLHEYFRLCWQCGQIPKSWQNSHTLLISKRSPSSDPANYRPIGLHNCTYKLYSCVVTSVLQEYFKEISALSGFQEGFRKQRNTGCLLMFLKRVQEDAQLHHRDLFLLAVDFKSAFYRMRIDQDRLYFIMGQIGLPTDAVDVVKGIYSGATTQVKSTAGLTGKIRVRRRTIQGDVLSPLLFLIAMEPLMRWPDMGGKGIVVAVCPATTLWSSPPQDMQMT